MQSKALTPEKYMEELPEDRKATMKKLRTTILENLPKGFEEVMSYGMIGYVVPHSIYPPGYHCDPKLPLPFINIASQKNFIAVYHMGLYANEQLLQWFLAEYEKLSAGKLDMGKSCLRFKPAKPIPYEIIGKLVSKVKPEEWVSIYEKAFRK